LQNADKKEFLCAAGRERMKRKLCLFSPIEIYSGKLLAFSVKIAILKYSVVKNFHSTVWQKCHSELA